MKGRTEGKLLRFQPIWTFSWAALFRYAEILDTPSVYVSQYGSHLTLREKKPSQKPKGLRMSADSMSFWTFFFKVLQFETWMCRQRFLRTVYRPVSRCLMSFMQHRNCSTQFMTPCMFWGCPLLSFKYRSSKQKCLPPSFPHLLSSEEWH